jgi:hypothetical protein
MESDAGHAGVVGNQEVRYLYICIVSHENANYGATIKLFRDYGMLRFSKNS